MAQKELINKIKIAVSNTGYPFEQKIGIFLERKGWHVFHSINYVDPIQNKEHELDILAYKLINQRRIELRISCKKSINKPWVFFTEDASRYLEHGNILKITPILTDINKIRRIPKILKDLEFFSHKRRAINFTAFYGKELNDQYRDSIVNGLFSTLTSVYHRIYPYDLLSDSRGTIYFFILLFDGLMFESFYDFKSNKDIIKSIDYMSWDNKLLLNQEIKKIYNANGKLIDLSDVLYYFSDWFRVEIVKWTHFRTYLNKIEKVFGNLTLNDLKLFGNLWIPKNFPKIVRGFPKIK